jgi:S-formylglutathione hydrolase FrmB
MKRIIFLFAIGFLFSLVTRASVTDTISTFSNSMEKQIKAVVITPDGYDKARECPVLYLLHGYSGNYSDWVKKDKSLSLLADQYQMIIVCPDGGFSSWYFDSPVDKTIRYETYVSKELISFIDGKYKTIKNRKGRAITGLSMGGHGALYLAFRHQDIFGAAGSMSGGVDIRPFPNNWDIKERLGSYDKNKDNWENNTVINMVNLLTPKSLALIFDCGTEDFFFQVNRKLHEELLYRNIPHDFITRPGGHSWPYWMNSIEYQALFFSNYFRESAQQ